MAETLEDLKKLKQEYVEAEAQKIVDYMVKRELIETQEQTCDHRNWDTKKHTHFPEIAERLRKEYGLLVLSKVRHGVTEWDIRIR